MSGPAGAAAPGSSAVAKSFSQHAENKVWTLLKDSDNQVGSQYPGDRSGKTVTDCITYVRLVLEYAFDQTGNRGGSSGVRANYEKGTQLAQYLVGLGWSAYYWNPDVRLPKDGNSEHPVSYKMAVSSKAYYGVPVKGFIINYNLTPQPSPIFSRAAKRTPDMTAFNNFSKVRFAYGLARGGKHTFLLSFGMVYEVHWDAIGGDPKKKLYDRTPFWDYAWRSGLVVTPPDSGFTV